MKQIDIDVVKTNSQSPRSFYQRTFADIDAHERALSQEIEELQLARQQILRLKAQLPDVDSSRCLFCGGVSRDLSLVIENSNAFGYLGSGALALERERHDRSVPLRWECQTCGAFDVDLPSGSRVWSRNQLPGPKTLWRQMLNAFPNAEAVALEESSHGTIWMLQVAAIWYFLPGTAAKIVEQLKSKVTI